MDAQRGRGALLAEQRGALAAAAARPPLVDSLIVQRYIENPFLVGEGHKFDIRIFVAVTSVRPLRLYIYDEGYAKVARARFNDSATHLEASSHFTNLHASSDGASLKVAPDVKAEVRGCATHHEGSEPDVRS